MRYRVLPYKQGSRSAKALAEALGGKVLRLEGSTFKPKADDVVINWGRTEGSSLLSTEHTYLNLPHYLKAAADKLKFLNKMRAAGVECIPDFYTSKEDIPDEAFPVVCRTVLSGHSGAGIVIASNRDELVEAPLYTRYIKKKDEYRVHLGRANDGSVTVISLQRKARRLDCPDPNWRVRNHANGFVFARSDVDPPQCVLDAARESFEASGLDFGGCDVIYNDKQGKAYVLEINTACGLEGQTVTDYAAYFKGLANG